MRRIYILFFLLFAISVTTPLAAQVKGGRKREHRNQRSSGSIFKRKRSSGHADAFASNSRKKSFFAKVFHKKSSSGWAYRKTKPGAQQKREQSRLFTRQRSSGRNYKERQLSMQNKRRSRTRDRGNKTFKAIKK